MEEIYNTKFIQSGDRLEIYKYRGYIKKGGESRNNTGRKGKKELSAEEKEENRLKSKFENLNKTRNKIVRLVNSNQDMISFITLTYSENMIDIKKSKRQLNTFFQKLREDFEDLKYLYVLEFQDRGAIHYHILTNYPIPCGTGRYKKTIKQKEFEQYMHKKYWKHGFVDCRNLGKEGNTNIGKYISAYITSDLYDKDLKGMRIFAYSRNIEKPKITTIETKLSYEQLSNIEGYNLDYYSTYEINYINKNGSYRNNQVNYFDFKIKQ